AARRPPPPRGGAAPGGRGGPPRPPPPVTLQAERAGTTARTIARVRGKDAGIVQQCKTCARPDGPVGIEFVHVSGILVAPELHECALPRVIVVHTTISSTTNGVRDILERVLSSYQEIDSRFAAVGGLGRLLNLYEQLQRELERVSYEEIDRMTAEIRTVIEALLKMDYELRRVNNLKLAFDARQPGSTGGER